MFEPLFAASQARVLRFLARNSGNAFFEREIVEATGVSRSAVNLATRALQKADLLLCERRGRMNFYTANDRHPFVRQFKVLDTLAQLGPLLNELRPLARQIILFGSCAEGTNSNESDLDLFILTPERGRVMALISQFPADHRIQPIITNSQELAALKEKDAAFYAQVRRGIVLWEATDELGT
jgi:DNA-binding transcriptional ArsR family regulator